MPDETTTPEQTVPYARFAEVVGEKNKLTSEIKTLQERAATADTLARQVEAATAAKAEIESRFDRFRTMASAGITDPEAVEAVEWQYGRLPEKDRPPLPAWLKSLKEAPESAPLLLRPLFQPAQPPGGAPPPPKAPPPPPGAPTPGNDSGAPAVTPEMVRAARERATQTGNMTELREMMKKLAGQK